MVGAPLNRHGGARGVAAVVCLLLCGAPDRAHAQAGSPPIELWVLTANPDGPIVRGARMGAAEMDRTASLLGRQFVLREVLTTSDAGAGDAVTALRRSSRATFVLLDVADVPACNMARTLAAVKHAIVLNARVPERPCVAPWLLLRLPAERRSRALSERGDRSRQTVDEWHSSLQRFGATELNQRYERRSRNPMDGGAWAGWFAAKVAAESALRLEHLDRAALVGSAAPAFDGHKGVALRFDSAGVLQQPVYIIDSPDARGRVIGEIP